jgi:hypothetical protein
VKEALRLHMQAHPAPTSQHHSFQEQFQKEVAAQLKGDDILQPHEKVQVKERLVHFMDNHPAEERVPLNVRIGDMLMSFTRGLIPQTAAAFAVVLITGSSIAWAAEDTLPGDVLYPVKTGILEPMRAAMVNDPAAKAEKVADCARKRLLEAEKLLTNNRLTTESWQELQSNMNANLDRADTLIASIAETDPETAATLSADLNVMLDMYHQVFGEAGAVWSNTVAVDAAQGISTAAVRFAAHHEMNEEKVLSDDATAAILTKRVVHSVSDVINRLPVPKDGNVDVSATARDLLKDAEERLEKGEFRDSLKAARMAIRKAQENEALARLGLKIEITAATEASSSELSSSTAAATSTETHTSSVTYTSSATKSSKDTAASSTQKQSSSIVESSSAASIVIELPVDLPVIPDPVVPVVEEVLNDVTDVVPVVPSLLP